MALIRMSLSLASNSEYVDIIDRAFDSFQIISRNETSIVARVQNDEIPYEDVFICPTFVYFPNIHPFAIDWGLPNW